MYEEVWVLMYANHRNICLDNLENTLKKWNHNYKICGIGDTWVNFSTLMKGICRELYTLSPNKIVCIIDAFDVFATGPPSDLGKKYEKYDGKIVVGAEQLNTKFPESLRYYEYHGLIKSQLKYPYINSGLVMGRVDDLFKMYKWALKNKYTDDQVAVINYAEKYPQKVVVDYAQEFMANITPFYPYEIYDSRIFNTETAQTPVFAHVPGSTVDLYYRMDKIGTMLLGNEYLSLGFSEKFSKFSNAANPYIIGGIIIAILVVLIFLCFRLSG